MKVSLRGAIAACIIVAASVACYFLMAIFAVFLLALIKYGFGERAASYAYPIFNVYFSWLETHWYTMVATLLELVEGTKVSYTIVDGAGQVHLEQSSSCRRGDSGRMRPSLRQALSPPSGPGKAKILLMNHHCRADWIYFFPFCARSTVSASLRIVLKEDLKKLPVFGNAMEHYRFLFLSRSWEKDDAYLRGMMEYYKRTGDSVVILIFPEGTDLSESNIAKSQAYATKNGLPLFRHVLNPRTTGLIAIKNMLGPENVEEIVDCTIAYTYGEGHKRPAESSLVDGTHPKKVHLLLRRYRVDTATSVNTDDLQDRAPGGDDEALKIFMHDRFSEKEQLLSRFYTNNPVGFDAHDVRAVLGEGCGVLTYDPDQEHARAAVKKTTAMMFMDEVGLRSLVPTVLLWAGVPLLALTRCSWWLLAVYYVAGIFVQSKVAGYLGGTQQWLFLKQVADKDTLLAKLTGTAQRRPVTKSQ